MSPPEPPRDWRGGQGRKALVIVALVVSLGFLSALLSATEGHFVPQVIDLYLVCQYAKAMAEGHPFHFNPEDPASSGATSLLQTVVLAGAHALGIRGEGLVAFAILMGAACLVGSALLAHRVASRLAGPREGFLAGALVALSGPVAWGFLSGSDVGLAMLLCLWLFDGLLVAWAGGPERSLVAAATLLALARPEGLPLALAIAAALTLRRGGRGRAALLRWLPAVAGLAVLALNRALTGAWLGTSVAGKSLVFSYGLTNTLAAVSAYGGDVARGLLLGFYPSEATIGLSRGWASVTFPPLALAFVLLGAAAAPEPYRGAVRAWLLMVVAVFALVSPNVFMGVHFNRYLMWAFPTLLALTAVGLGLLARLLGRLDPALDRPLFGAVAALMLALGVLSTARIAVLYGEIAGGLWLRDVSAAQWIQRTLPPGVRMANAVTSVEYLTGHTSLNLYGVTRSDIRARATEREAVAFEALGRVPESQRPRYFITSVSTQESYSTFQELVDGPPIFQTTSLSSDEILIFRMRWDAVGRNRRIAMPETLAAVSGLREVDRLNVCDSWDEAEHGYSFESRLGPLLLAGAARVDSYPRAGDVPSEPVIDAGRVILGAESFQVRGTARGRDLVVVLRTAASAAAAVVKVEGSRTSTLAIPEAGLVVEAGGRPAGRFDFRLGPGWAERVLRVPGALVGDGSTALRLSGRYASFYYWFYQ